MLPCICSVIDHSGRQNVVRTSATNSAAPRVPLFCSLIPHFEVICDLLLNRHMATWNLFVKLRSFKGNKKNPWGEEGVRVIE